MASSRHQRSWSVGVILHRANEVLRREGVRSLWFKVLGEVCYRRLLFLERVLEGSPAAGTTGFGQLSSLSLSDLNRYGRFRPGADLNEIRKRLERGGICFAMLDDSEIMHVCWIASGSVAIDYLGCAIELPEGVGYAYEAFTHPRFRSRGVAGARTRLMETPLIEAGFRSIVSAIGPENPKALHFNIRAGHKVVGLIGCFWLGRWRRHFCRIKGASFDVLAVKRDRLAD